MIGYVIPSNCAVLYLFCVFFLLDEFSSSVLSLLEVSLFSDQSVDHISRWWIVHGLSYTYCNTLSSIEGFYNGKNGFRKWAW